MLLRVFIIFMHVLFVMFSLPTISGSHQRVSASQGELVKAGSIIVMSFNVLGKIRPLCDGNEQNVVTYLIDNNIDVFVTQENECSIVHLAQVWQDRLQQKDSRARVAYTNKTPQITIVTRLPVDNPPENLQDIENTRIPLKVDDQDWVEGRHQGKLSTTRNMVVKVQGVKTRIIGFHGDCASLDRILKEFLVKFTDLPVVITGDFNCSARTFYRNVTQNNTSMLLLQKYNLSCFSPENPANFPYKENCGASTKPQGKYIPWFLEDRGNPENAAGPRDHVAVMKEEVNGTQLIGPKDDWIVRERSLSFSDHYPVKATVDILTRSPLPPQPGSADINTDGKVDIFDYNILLGMFGKTGGNGFHAADITQNGVVDIFDYNALIGKIGK